MERRAEDNGALAVLRSGSSRFTLLLACIAALCLLASLKLPLWQMRMEAPQYREEEALRVVVHANRMSGDLGEIAVLNQYIGVHAPTELPQFKWLPLAILGAAFLGLAAALLPKSVRRIGTVAVALALASSLGVAAFQAQKQMYDIGHKRDAKTKMARTKDFTLPLLGTAKLAQFTITARLGAGAFLIGAALALQLGAAAGSRRKCKADCGCGSLPAKRAGYATDTRIHIRHSALRTS